MWPWWLGCADEPTREPPGSEATHDTAGHTGHAVTASLEVEVTGGATGLRDLRCRARLVDGEAPVTLRWSVDGAPGPEGDHVRADRTQPGQRWRCDAEATVEGVVLTAADEHVVPTPPGENVLVIVLDDVGTDRFSAYGTSPTPAHTPRLDALADSAVRFETVYAAPACSTTRSRALTGRYNMRFGLMSSLREEDTFTFPDGELTLAELARLATVPRRTAAFGKWHLVTRESLTPDFVARQGFDRFRGTVGNLDSYPHWKEVDFDGVEHWQTLYPTTRVADDLLEFAATTPEPWFAWVAFHAAHGPYDVPDAALAPQQHLEGFWTLADVADGMLEAADTELGRILDTLGPEGLAHTTVFVLSDNGTAPEVAAPPLDADRVKTTVYEGGVRVPLWVFGRGVEHAGVSSALVDVVDVFPTVADLLGVPLVGDEGALSVPTPTGDVRLDGRSLLGSIVDPDAPGERDSLVSFVARTNGPPPWDDVRSTARDRTHKLVVTEDGREELYALGDALVEEQDLVAAGPLSAEHEAIRQRLHAELDRVFADATYAW